MDSKAYKAYYVGYDIESNSHKVFNSITKMVITSVNVKFDITPFNIAPLKSSLKMTRPTCNHNRNTNLQNGTYYTNLGSSFNRVVPDIRTHNRGITL